MANTVTLNIDNLILFGERMKKMNRLTVTVGFQGPGGRQRYSTGINVATVALYNEFGTRDIPARSFLRSTLFEQRQAIQAAVTVAATEVVNGLNTPISAMSDVGRKVARMVVEKIRRSRAWAKKNADSTVAIKGFDWPLHETLKLRDSISWAVRKGSARGSILAMGTT